MKQALSQVPDNVFSGVCENGCFVATRRDPRPVPAHRTPGTQTTRAEGLYRLLDDGIQCNRPAPQWSGFANVVRNPHVAEVIDRGGARRTG